MELFKSALPLLGVLIGAILSGIGSFWRVRVERKRTIALALADLLEVRHHVFGIDVVLKEANKRFNVPAEASLVLQNLVEQLSPINADVHKRYDDAVSLLAGIDPVLAFTLRSKNTLPNLLGTLKGLAESAGVSMNDIVRVENTLRHSLAPHLNEAVIELAGQHSFLTKRRVKRLIAKSEELPADVKAIFNQLADMDALNVQQQAA